jgi:hypothetical protein
MCRTFGASRAMFGSKLENYYRAVKPRSGEREVGTAATAVVRSANYAVVSTQWLNDSERTGGDEPTRRYGAEAQ